MRIPSLDDPDLAYETGLHIGDGCMSHYSRYDYRYALSGNLTTEKQYYGELVVHLIGDLYDLKAKVSEYRNSIYATVYSKSLVQFKSQEIDLPVGRKDALKHLPMSIVMGRKNSIAPLLAGLFDADGSVKTRKTPSGNYPRISLAQKTKTIIQDVQVHLREDFGISSTVYRNDYFDPRVAKTEVRWFLDINGYPNFRRFVDAIGTRHPNIQSKIKAFNVK